MYAEGITPFFPMNEGAIVMPAITIQSLELRQSQKEIIAGKFATILSELTNVPKDRIYIFFDGYPPEDTAKGDVMFSQSLPKNLIAKFNEQDTTAP